MTAGCGTEPIDQLPAAPAARLTIVQAPIPVPGQPLALVDSMQAEFGIPPTNVRGHAMANAAPHFHDLRGRRNDHADWAAADVAEFRSRLWPLGRVD